MNFFNRIFRFLSGTYQSSYRQVDGRWAWVSYDKGAGKRVSVIVKADQDSFHLLKGSAYALDKASVFYKGQLIPKANPRTFVVIDASLGYAKDGQNIFLETIIIPHTHLPSFEVLQWPYARDQSKVYCGMLPMSVDDPSSFMVKQSSGIRRTSAIDLFITQNPDYKWLKEMDIAWVIYGSGSGSCNGQLYEDFWVKV